MTVVTRFAPSPTGHLHIGGARTAAFCWFFAQHFGGKFLLRIEDTDLERSKQEYTDSILASMSWLGLECEGEPLYQTKRFAIYNEYIETLLSNGHAYWCECSPEKVEAMREKARAEGEKPRYDGCCRQKRLGPGAGRVVRLAAPKTGRVVFEDFVKGHVAFDAEELDDMVLLKSDGAPTYNFAVVIDDVTMQVTHVIRGDDHVNNTPKQVLIYQALNVALPVFAHVPMILGADKQKLSKRHGAKAVIEYEQDGLLPEALLNYLVRLGWSHGDQEIFTMQEMVNAFDGSNLNSSPAAFDAEKLQWVNAQHLRAKTPHSLFLSVTPFLQKIEAPLADAALIERLIPLFQPRVSNLVELAAQLKPLLVSAAEMPYDMAAVAKSLSAEGKEHVKAFAVNFAALSSFDKESIHDALHSYVEQAGIKFKVIGPALRVALLGGAGGPDLAELMAALGKEASLQRIERALTLA